MAASTEVLIRAATDSDRPAILELIRQSMGEGPIPRSMDYWVWKHVENPFGPSPGLVAESEGQIVGVRVFMRWSWACGGRRLSAVRAVDTATHPQWRGKGIFSRLTLALVEQLSAEGVNLVFNTPNDLSRPGYLKMGWTSLGRLSLWVRPQRPLRLLRAWRASRNQPATEPQPDGGEAREMRFPFAHDLLAAPRMKRLLGHEGGEDLRLTTLRTVEYLRWRYVDIPGLQYRAAWEISGNDGAALIFRVLANRGLSELRLCEVLVGATPASRVTARSLLRATLGQAGTDFCSAIGGANTPERRVLMRSGFLPAPRLGPTLTVRPLNPFPECPDPMQRSAWRLSIGDLELF